MVLNDVLQSQLAEPERVDFCFKAIRPRNINIVRTIVKNRAARDEKVPQGAWRWLDGALEGPNSACVAQRFIDMNYTDRWRTNEAPEKDNIAAIHGLLGLP
jgi:hypothetical protein